MAMGLASGGRGSSGESGALSGNDCGYPYPVAPPRPCRRFSSVCRVDVSGRVVAGPSVHGFPMEFIWIRMGRSLASFPDRFFVGYLRAHASDPDLGESAGVFMDFA